MSGTMRRFAGALLFIPIVAVVAFSQEASQWLLLALATILVLEFSAMLSLPMALRAALVMDFVLFALPAPLFARFEHIAGMSLMPMVAALIHLLMPF